MVVRTVRQYFIKGGVRQICKGHGKRANPIIIHLSQSQLLFAEHMVMMMCMMLKTDPDDHHGRMMMMMAVMKTRKTTTMIKMPLTRFCK